MIFVYYADQSVHAESVDGSHYHSTVKINELTMEFNYDPISGYISMHAYPMVQPYSTQPLTDRHASIYLLNQNRIHVHCVDEYHYGLTSSCYMINDSMISIGSDADNDIVINLPWIEAHHGYIHVAKRTIHGNFFHVNHQGHNLHFDDYDVLDIDGLTMIIHDQTISIMDSDLIQVNLSEQPSSLMANMHFTFMPTYIVHQHEQRYVPVTLKQTIPNAFLEQPSFHVPILVTMGPMLIMGIASLAAAALMAYQRYWQGYDLMDSLPSLVLPLVLILSTLIFQPLNRFFEKRRAKITAKKRFDDFELQWSAMRQKGEATYARFKANLDSYYPTTADLIERFDATTVHGYTKSNDELTIRLGSGTIDTDFIIDGVDQYMTQPLLYKRLCDYQDSLLHANGAKLLTLNDGETIKLIDQTNTLYQLIMIQLVTSYAPDQIKIAYLVEPSFLMQHAEALDSPYTLDQDQWLVFFDDSSLQQYASNCKFRLIVFSQFYISDSLNAIVIYLDQADLPSDIALILNQDQLQVYTPTSQDQFMVEPLENPLNIIYKLNQWFPWRPAHLQSMDIFLANQWLPISVEHYQQICEANEWNDELKCLFAMDDDGIFSLDLSENADGPHGLLAGTTGSGKSECALSLLVSLALRYSPNKVNFLVVDFKGSALASQLAKLPHYVGTLDNLSINEVNRFLNALQYETRKRQQLLLDASKKHGTTINGIDQYRHILQNDQTMENMAHLVVLIDEFAELKAQVPEFIDAIISLARIGRSLGIHLILSTQKPNGVINDQILANTRFRICLRVNDKADSMEMLNHPMASTLKQPGEFYCLKDQGISHGQCFYLNGCYDPNHHNIHGSIMDLTAQKSRQIHDIRLNLTYMDTLLPIIGEAYEKRTWLLKPAVQVRQLSKDEYHDNMVLLGEYDDQQTMMVKPLSIDANFNRILIAGSKQCCTNMIYLMLAQLDTLQIIKESIVVIISDDVSIDGCECIHSSNFNRIEMVITTLIKTDIDQVILFIDGVDDLIRSNPSLNDLLVLLDNRPSVQLVLTMHHGNGALLRNFTHMDCIVVDAQCDITIKSLFFTSLKLVSEAKKGFGYVVGINEPVALFEPQPIHAIHDSNRRIADPYQPFAMTSSCFAKAYYTNQEFSLQKGMIFTASSMLRLNALKNDIEKLNLQIELSDHYDPEMIAFMPLQAFNDNETHYLYEQTPLIFVGGGVHQQFVFPFGKFEENQRDDAIYIYGSTMIKLRLGVSHDHLHSSFA